MGQHSGANRWISHVAVTVPASALDARGREALKAFYGQVLGWTEIERLRRDDRLSLEVSDSAYLNIRSRDEPMQTSGYEHLGLWIDSPEEFDAVCERARAWARRDAEAVVEEPAIVATKRGAVHNVRLHYRLPLAIELQCFKPSAGPAGA